MKIQRIGFDESMVLVMGAGATRGASFVKTRGGVLPPLDSDFFTQLQRMSKAKPADLVAENIANAVRLFGPNFEATMEDFFTHVEHLKATYEDGLPPALQASNPYPSMRDRFIQGLAAVLDESIGKRPRCEYHARLVKAMSAEDTIISFNYDTLLDYTLKQHGQLIWNPASGYGVPAVTSGKDASGTDFWAPRKRGGKVPTYPESDFRLLKMHGSLNWFPFKGDAASSRLSLRQRWWHQRGQLHFEIVPPEWNKPVHSGVYGRIWNIARERLRGTRQLAIIGYSLPRTDLPAQALMMIDSVGQSPDTAPSLEHLVLVNPDRDSRRRIRRTLWRRIDASTRILCFDTLAEFSRFLEEDVD
jgi:hypothetical protein